MIYLKLLDLPVGPMSLVFSDENILGLFWESEAESSINTLNEKQRIKKRLEKQFKSEIQFCDKHPLLTKTVKQLKEYFSGTRTEFDLPIAVDGTAFQKKAWQALIQIPYGRTVSYFEQAQKIGSPKGFRAVGSANSKNPISIIVPCHRVISKNGSTSGYAGGIENKIKLLELEKLNLSRNTLN